MSACGKENGVMRRGQTTHREKPAEPGADRHDPMHSTIARARQQRVDLAVKLRKIEVAMTVGQQRSDLGTFGHGTRIIALNMGVKNARRPR